MRYKKTKNFRQKKGGQEGETDEETALVKSLEDMFYANDAGVASRLPKQLMKMMGIVVVCAAFGLTVWEAKTEIICLCMKGMSEATTIFSIDAAGQMYN